MIAAQRPFRSYSSLATSPKPFIYRIYADSRAKFFIYRIYALPPGGGGGLRSRKLRCSGFLITRPLPPTDFFHRAKGKSTRAEARFCWAILAAVPEGTAP